MAALIAGCSASQASPAPSPSPRCDFRLPAAPARADAPLAIIRDVAAGPTEYLLGTAGGAVVRLDAADGFSPPHLAGDSLFFSVRHGQDSLVYRGRLGGCAGKISVGTLGEDEAQGRALSALVDNRWVMLDGSGHRLTNLTGAAGTWTLDGRLVEPTVAGLDIYDMQGKRRSISKSGVAPMGSLGAHEELVSTATGIQLLDIDTGALRPLSVPPQLVLRGPSGAPDGSRVAFLDQSGAAQVLEFQTGRVTALHAPALATGFAWSRDSQWVAVQTVYGGSAFHVADGRVVEGRSLVVVSW